MPAQRLQITFAIPGDPNALTGGTLYDRRMMRELQGLGQPVDLLSLPDGFPLAGAEARQEALRLLGSLPSSHLLVLDGLAGGALPEELEVLGRRRDIIMLLHHPLADELGLAPAEQEQLFVSEKEALRHCRHIVVTSPTTAKGLAERYEVPEDKLSVILPGVDKPSHLPPRSLGSPQDPLTLLCVASITPRKGHSLLIEALAQLTEWPWTLTLVGSRERERACAAKLEQEIARLGLSERVSFLEALPPQELSTLYQKADLYLQPSFLEGYGMAIAEALAQGLPVITTQGAAIVDTLPAGQLTVLPVGDLAALRESLAEHFANPQRREQALKGAAEAAKSLKTWEETAAQFADLLQAVRR